MGDDAEKTEEPTPRKLEKAREDGDVVSSQEVKNWSIVIASTLATAVLVPTLSVDVLEISRVYIEQSHAIAVDFNHLHLVLSQAAWDLLWALLPFMLLLIVFALGGSVVVSGFVWAPKKIAPKYSNIDPVKGVKKVISAKSLVEGLKSIFKLVVVVGLAALAVVPFVQDFTLFPQMDFVLLLSRLHLLVIIIGLTIVGIMTVLAVVDFIYQKHTHNQKMRMTKSEVDDERKQMEGDPKIKARIRQIRMERFQQRITDTVPEATVVITNPTHYAVALKYDMQSMEVPILVAKGVDHIALRIREIAEENNVPVVENPPLARTLYAAVEVDEEIPEEHYKAVAGIISYVMGL